ncbi:hypothetical protein BD779DRAFT_1547916 [Infundibulicybe gibba]|nr:hypothetical protein BD779DRAFT_1547916 [Infundibulicybe gibba]
MPLRPRASPSAAPAASFCPPNDTSTYRDLLLFEERLKTNAASLQKRKVRYQLFLGQLLLVIVFLLYEVLAPPASSLLAVPYTAVLCALRLADDGDLVAPNAYGTVGMLFVCVTTLVLFFASGLYSEKIGYANK